MPRPCLSETSSCYVSTFVPLTLHQNSRVSSHLREEGHVVPDVAVEIAFLRVGTPVFHALGHPRLLVVLERRACHFVGR